MLATMLRSAPARTRAFALRRGAPFSALATEPFSMPHELQAFVQRLAALPQPGRVRLALDESTGIARLTLCNAERKNSLSGPMMAELSDHVATLEAWTAGAAVIVEGESGSFCAGADLELVRHTLSTPEQGMLMSELMTCVLGRLRDLPMLSVAAVDGAAMGGGAELATATDWRVFASDARLQFVQTLMGLSTGWGGGGRLVQLVGRSRALELLLRAPRLDAERAKAVGLADEIAAPGEAAADAAMRLCVLPAIEQAAATETVRALKTAVAAHSRVGHGTAAETRAFGAVFGSEANHRAVDAAVARMAARSAKGRRT